MPTGDGSTQRDDVEGVEGHEHVETARRSPSHPENPTDRPPATAPAAPATAPAAPATAPAATPVPPPAPPYQSGGYPAGGYPPAPYGYPPPRRPPSRPRRRIWPYVVAGIVLVPVLFVGCAYVVLDRVTDRVSGDSGIGGSRDAADEPPAIDEAHVTECAATESGRLRAVVVVENTTSTTWTYAVEINFLARDGAELGNAFALVSGLPSGATSTPVQATDTAFAPPDGYTCSVAAVNRV